MLLEDAQKFAGLALAGLDREYPNKPNVLLLGPGDRQSPRGLHPSFYGCFDWHSAVHGHWLLVRLLRRQPDLASADEIRARLEEHLAGDRIEVEAAYFRRPENAGFERMYGWAWALRLVLELKTWDDPAGARWAQNLAPLERELVRLVRGFLPRLTYPVRTGTHPDTGFALGQIWDYAQGVADAPLASLLRDRALRFYGNDRDYPIGYEPSGEDFLSSGLNEADLMRRVLEPPAFARWLEGFWPGLSRGELGGWGVPAEVSDLSDPRIVHLVGLNLSRAWTLRGIAAALASDDARRPLLERAAKAHEIAGREGIFTGDYGGEHWLGTFAVYLLTKAGLP